MCISSLPNCMKAWTGFWLRDSSSSDLLKIRGLAQCVRASRRVMEMTISSWQLQPTRLDELPQATLRPVFDLNDPDMPLPTG
jgi:hypothetical protein